MRSTRTHLASDVLSEHLLVPQGDSGLTAADGPFFQHLDNAAC